MVIARNDADLVAPTSLPGNDAYRSSSVKSSNAPQLTSRHFRHAHTAAGHRIKHPLRISQEPTSRALIDTAPTHSSSYSWSESSWTLRRAKGAKGNGLLQQYYGCCIVDSYHEERNHQGKENRILFPFQTKARRKEGAVRCRERLGGLLRYYEREAA